VLLQLGYSWVGGDESSLMIRARLLFLKLCARGVLQLPPPSQVGLSTLQEVKFDLPHDLVLYAESSYNIFTH